MDVRLAFPLAWFASSLRALRPLRSMIFVLLLLITSALSNVALGQANPELQNYSWDFSVWAAGATGEEVTNSFSEAQLFTAGVSVGHALSGEIGSGWRRGHLEYSADFVPVFVQFAPQKITGTAFDPILLRWNSSVHHGRLSPFVELGGGGVHTHSDFPQGDTSTFNFMARAGGGVVITTRRAQALEIACRWLHISNANLGPQNPEFNGVQLSLGWHWFK
jgi:hypothetical protein